MIYLISFIVLLPLIVVLLLNLYALNSSKPIKIVRNSSLSEDNKAKAINCINEVKSKCYKELIYDITAPYVILVVLPFVRWEAEKLPKLFQKWDNEISINGDHNAWDTSTLLPLPAPLEDTEEIRQACYYAKGHHPRSFWARYIWLGLRNRASKAAYDVGIEIPLEKRNLVKHFGDINVGKKLEGKTVEGWLISQYFDSFDIYNIEVKKNFIIRTRYGYKIRNVLLNDPRVNKAMPVGIGISFKRYKKE